MVHFLEAMSLPMLACFLLAGIHAWLGLHVLERGVLFVDLALAQLAALGALVAMGLGWEVREHPLEVGAFSLCFALAGALGLGLLRSEGPAARMEAKIGVVYVASLAAGFVVASTSPAGMEGVDSLLEGSILWVTGPQLARAAGLYGAVALVHGLLGRALWRSSREAAQGLPRRAGTIALDLVFYGGFALVVTSSVQIAGVPLVFALLVVPATAVVGWSVRPLPRMLLAWGFAGVASILGVGLSWVQDWPSGPSVVLSLVGGLVLCAALRSAWRAPRRGRALTLRAAVGLALVLGWMQRHHLAPDPRAPHSHSAGAPALERLREDLRAEGALVRLQAVEGWPQEAGGEFIPLLAVLSDTDFRVRAAAAEALAEMGEAAAAPSLWSAAQRETAEPSRVRMDAALLRLGDPRGLRGPIERGGRGDSAADLELLRRHLPEQGCPFSASLDPGSAQALLDWLDEWEFDLVPGPDGRFRVESD